MHAQTRTRVLTHVDIYTHIEKLTIQASESYYLRMYVVYAHTPQTHRWYGIFSMAKGFAVGIALGLLTTPEQNSGFLFAVFAIDFAVQAWFQPQVDIES
jgi:hypothetical protein